MNKPTYADLPDEDKLLMDDLFKYKEAKDSERRIIRDISAKLKKIEMKCTEEIMNLTQREIGEKFDLGANSAKPLTKSNRKNIEAKIKREQKRQSSRQNILKRINEKKICSENGQQSNFYCKCPVSDSRSVG